MRVPNEQQALQQVAAQLAKLLDEAGPAARIYQEPRAQEADAVIEVGETAFVVAWKGSGAAAPTASAIERVRQSASARDRPAIPLVAVPYMGPTGGRRCEEAGVAWLDLSGNARIVAPGVRVLIEGQPNQFKRRGRPINVFAPKSARIARWLLMHPRQATAQREIAQATGVDEGFTSRIVSRLVENDLVVREDDGGIRPADPDLLLDSWREVYDFSKHQTFPGHLAARSGEETLRLLARGLQDQGVRYAATGLAAAWLSTRFAGFRLVTLYVTERPGPEVQDHLGLREEERGANVWLVVPKDEGVFQGAGERDGVVCVHPVQIYLDLKEQPERAKEAADHLRAELLKWGADG